MYRGKDEQEPENAMNILNDAEEPQAGYKLLENEKIYIIEDTTSSDNSSSPVGCDDGYFEQVTDTYNDFRFKHEEYDVPDDIKEEATDPQVIIIDSDNHTQNIQSKPRSNKKHYKTNPKNDNERFQCDLCDFKTSIKLTFMCHFRSEHDANAEWEECQFCDFITRLQLSLIKHLRWKHKISREFHCKICKFKTKTNRSLRRHHKARHDQNDEWYRCQLCNYKCKFTDTLAKHQSRIHEENLDTYQCVFCEYTAKRKFDFLKHYKNKHDQDVEWHQCEHCEFKTKYKRYLNVHTSNKHVKKVNNQEPTILSRKDSKCTQADSG